MEIVESIEGPFYSFPHIGVLERAFSDFNEIAEDGNKVISQVFNRADYAWNEEIRRVSIQDMLEEVFSGYGEIPKRDWNQWM